MKIKYVGNINHKPNVHDYHLILGIPWSSWQTGSKRPQRASGESIVVTAKTRKIINMTLEYRGKKL